MKFNIHVTKMRDVDPLLHALGEKRKTSLFPQPPPFERGLFPQPPPILHFDAQNGDNLIPPFWASKCKMRSKT